MHEKAKIDQDRKKKLADTVEYHDTSKTDVDMLDQLVRYHTSKSVSRCWPVAGFFNNFQLACINATMIWK